MECDPALEEDYRNWRSSGDEAVLARLVATASPRAFRQALRMVGDPGDAEDVVQEAFIRLLRTAETHGDDLPLHARLGYLVHCAALVCLRSRRRRRHHEERGMSTAADPQAASTCDEEALRAAVAALPEPQRAVIDLHYFAGLGQADAAKALGLSGNAFAVRLHRAREALRTLLVRRGVSVGGAALLALLVGGPAQAAPLPSDLPARVVAALRTPSVATRFSEAADRTRWPTIGLMAVALAVALSLGFWQQWLRSAPPPPQPSPAGPVQRIQCQVAERAPQRPTWFRVGPEHSSAWIFAGSADDPHMHQIADLDERAAVELAVADFATQRAVGAFLQVRFQPGTGPASLRLGALGPTQDPGLTINLAADGSWSVMDHPLHLVASSGPLPSGIWLSVEAAWLEHPTRVRARWWPTGHPCPEWQLDATVPDATRIGAGPVSLRTITGRVDVGDVEVMRF